MVTNSLPIQDEITTSVDYGSIFKRRWQPALCLFLGVCILNTINVLSKSPTYRATGLLRLNVANETSQLVNLEELDLITGKNSDRQILTEIDIMRSKPVLKKTLITLREQPRLSSSDSPLELSSLEDYEGLKASLTITPNEDTDIVRVDFESSEPHVAYEMVNQLMETYVDFNLQENQSKASAARKFISQELPQVKKQVLVADQALRQFMEANQVSGLEDLAEVITEGQINIQTQLDTVTAQISKVEAESIKIRGQLGVNLNSALDISTVSQLSSIREARAKLQEVNQNLALARASLKPEHPILIDLEEQQQQLQGALQTAIRTATGKNLKVNQQPVDSTRQGLINQLLQLSVTRQGLLKQQKALTVQMDAYNGRSNQLPAVGQRLRHLQRELEVAETTFKALLQRLQSAQLTENQTIPTAKIVELADIPTNPVAPNKVLEIFRGGMAGAVLAVGLVLFLEKIDSKLKTVDDIRDAYLSLPVLGSVPIHESKPGERVALPTVINPRSPIAEAYRMLRANLRFLCTESPIRVLTFSSALPQEGKSWTSANLAVVLSQMDYQVLLIDADLRQPTQHLIWEVSNQTGLSNILATTEDQGKSSLITHSVQPNLDLLTSGSLPPNPHALIDSKRFHAFVAQQAYRYDFVLIDTPPLIAAADALIIAQETDGLLLVGRPEYLEKSSAKRAKELLEQSGTTVLGLFINGIITKNESYSYYYYSHAYHGDSKSKASSSPQRSLLSLRDRFHS